MDKARKRVTWHTVVTSFIVATTLVYMGAAFVEWDWYPGDWKGIHRFFYAIIWFTLFSIPFKED